MSYLEPTQYNNPEIRDLQTVIPNRICPPTQTKLLFFVRNAQVMEFVNYAFLTANLAETSQRVYSLGVWHYAFWFLRRNILFDV